MKNKINSFTKFINFCVLALFFISTLIFFTSCDNGNSPNDNTNEEQNNTQNTDYCEICDGVQTENCGIKHKCDDENCVDYKKDVIYKNGHTHDYCNEDGCILDDSVRHTTHDYCEKTDCDGSTHMGADHPTGTTYPDWSKETTIGGDPYNIPHIDDYAYTASIPEGGSIDNIEMLNLYNDAYKKYIQDFTFTDSFVKKFGNINISFKKFDNQNTDELIHYNKNFDYLIEQINSVCAPVFEEIANNTNEDLDKKMLYHYRAYTNEADKLGYSTNYFNGFDAETQYNAMKNTIKNTSFNKNYPIYETITKEDGTTEEVISKSASENLTAVLTKAANEMSVDVTDLQRIFNLSLTTNTLNSLHKSTATQTEHTVNNCPSNTILESVILPNISLNNYSTITPTSIHQDFGRELV